MRQQELKLDHIDFDLVKGLKSGEDVSLSLTKEIRFTGFREDGVYKAICPQFPKRLETGADQYSAIRNAVIAVEQTYSDYVNAHAGKPLTLLESDQVEELEKPKETALKDVIGCSSSKDIEIHIFKGKTLFHGILSPFIWIKEESQDVEELIKTLAKKSIDTYYDWFYINGGIDESNVELLHPKVNDFLETMAKATDEETARNLIYRIYEDDGLSAVISAGEDLKEIPEKQLGEIFDVLFDEANVSFAQKVKKLLGEGVNVKEAVFNSFGEIKHNDGPTRFKALLKYLDLEEFTPENIDEIKSVNQLLDAMPYEHKKKIVEAYQKVLQSS